MTKILFVCHGNICRSPMAEFVMKDLVKKAGLILHRLLHHLLHHLPGNLCRFMEICVGNGQRTKIAKNAKPVDITGFADL